MYKQNKYKILSNEPLTKDVYKMVLEGDTEYITCILNTSKAADDQQSLNL